MRVCVLALASLVAWFATICVLVHLSLAPSAAGTEGHPDNHEHLLEAAAVTTLANPKTEAPHGDGKISSGGASVNYLTAALQEENTRLREELSTVKDTAAVLSRRASRLVAETPKLLPMAPKVSPAVPIDGDGWPNETIFVSMASYRDRECAPTVARAFKQAAHPSRIFFGIFQQHNCSGGEDAEFPVPKLLVKTIRGVERADCLDCVANLGRRLDCPAHPACAHLWQVRVNRVHWLDTKGPTFARARSESLYAGETYIMGIDSHTNFAPGWDTIMIDMFKRIGNPKAIITAYPHGYPSSEQEEGGDNAQVNVEPARMTSICRTRRVQVGRTVSFKHDMNSVKRPSDPSTGGPVRVAFLAAGFNFAAGRRVREVPYDPRTPFLFDGEETLLAVRAWTRGYDFYLPDRSVVTHLYIPSRSPLRPTFWQYEWGKRAKVQYRTMLRVNWLLGLHGMVDPNAPLSAFDTSEADKYGLGTARASQQYWEWAGIVPGRSTEAKKLPEWSKNLCGVYSNGKGGMPLAPIMGEAA